MFFAVDPEEAKRQAELHSMAHDSAVHGILSFLDEMTKDQLEQLGMLIFAITSDDNGALLGAQYLGMIKQLARFKYGLCACGREHEDILSGNPHEPESRVIDLLRETEDSDPSETSETAAELRMKYKVVLGENGRSVTCVNCGLKYISLRDRMMKEPDDCHGCQLKAGHG